MKMFMIILWRNMVLNSVEWMSKEHVLQGESYLNN